jgi:hypothetical protein
MTLTVEGEAVDIWQTGKRAVLEAFRDLALRFPIVPSVRQTARALTSVTTSACPGDVVTAR